jgi:hypothetical protein
MKYIKVNCLVMCASVFVTYGSESVENIKKEYGLIFDKLFVQARTTLQKKENVFEWLCKKNQEEFKDIQNLTTDLRVELNFNRTDEAVIKKELQECLQKKIHDEAEMVIEMDKVTAENLQDFFHISGMICDVTFESDDACCNMIHDLKKEYRSALKELKIVDKARGKIEAIIKERDKQKSLDRLHQLIIVGAQRT